MGLTKIKYSDMCIYRLRNKDGGDEGAVLLVENRKKAEEVADRIKRPLQHFSGDYIYKTNTLLYGVGFITHTRRDAELLVQKAVSNMEVN